MLSGVDHCNGEDIRRRQHYCDAPLNKHAWCTNAMDAAPVRCTRNWSHVVSWVALSSNILVPQETTTYSSIHRNYISGGNGECSDAMHGRSFDTIRHSTSSRNNQVLRQYHEGEYRWTGRGQGGGERGFILSPPPRQRIQ